MKKKIFFYFKKAKIVKRKIFTLFNILFSISFFLYKFKISKIDHLLVGPWKGEVGYELLYWIPFVSNFIKKKKIKKITIISKKPFHVFYKKSLRHENMKFISLDDYSASKQIKASSEDIKIKLKNEINLKNKNFLLHPLYFYNFLRLNNINFIKIKLLIKLLNFDFFKSIKNNQNSSNNILIWIYHNDYLKKKFININLKKIYKYFDNKTRIIFIYSNESRDNHSDLDIRSINFFPETKKRKIKYLNYSKKNFNRSLPKIIEQLKNTKHFICTWGGGFYLGYYLNIPTTALFSQKPKIHNRHRHVENIIEKYLGIKRYNKYIVR